MYTFIDSPTYPTGHSQQNLRKEITDMALTGIERITNILHRKPVDRVGLYEHFWSETERLWRDSGEISEEARLSDLFGFDVDEAFCLNLTADLDFEPQVIEENEDTRVILDGNGAMLRRHKKHDTTPEHVGYTIKTRKDWEEHIKPLLTPSLRRVNLPFYRSQRQHCKEMNRFFTCSYVNVFESIESLIGHENFLMSMVLDPDWITDMVDTYCSLIIDIEDELFATEGMPDAVWFYDDLGYKGSPFMSPAMYRELIQPGHIRYCAHAHAMGLPVFMHCCGFVEPLLPDMIDTGIDLLEVIEVKAGMDLKRIHKNFGDRIALMGGFDARTLLTNDPAAVDRELEDKLPEVMRGYGYVLHSDHSIPPGVQFETYRHFVEKGLEIGRY